MMLGAANFILSSISRCLPVMYGSPRGHATPWPQRHIFVASGSMALASKVQALALRAALTIIWHQPHTHMQDHHHHHHHVRLLKKLS